MGVTKNFIEETASEVNETATRPTLYVFRNITQRARSVNDMAWQSDMDYMRSKDAHKKGRTSLNTHQAEIIYVNKVRDVLFNLNAQSCFDR